MSDPLISIVIPLYDKEQWIESSLISIYNQAYKNWECTIIDDGSTDGSLRIVENFMRSHPGSWKVTAQVNSGQTTARNLCIKSSYSDYIRSIEARLI